MGTLARKLLNAAAAASSVAITLTATPTGVASASDITTYSSVSIGTASSDRIVVLFVGTDKGTCGIVSATIDYGSGATAMSSSSEANQGNIFGRLFYLAVPTGTTATFAITYTATRGPSSSQNLVAVYSVTGANATPAVVGTDTSTDMDATDPLTTGSVSIPSNGGIILGANLGGAASSATWANATENSETSNANHRLSTASRTTSGTVTITCTGTVDGDDGTLAYIIFNPA